MKSIFDSPLRFPFGSLTVTLKMFNHLLFALKSCTYKNTGLAEGMPHYLRSENYIHTSVVWSGIQRKSFRIYSKEKDQPVFFTQKLSFSQ